MPRVSKRELYSLVENKQEMLIACISERVKRFEVPTELPSPRDRRALGPILTSFGAKLVQEISDSAVIAVFRLAVAAIGQAASRFALGKIMVQAQASGLIAGQPAELAEQFAGLLWRDLMVSLLLGAAVRPNPREIAGRARVAAADFLQLHPLPKDPIN